MKIFFSIVLNGLILFFIWYFLNGDGVSVIVEGWQYGWQAYLLGGLILWVLNSTVKPVLKLLGFPLFFIYPIVVLVINAIILWLLGVTLNDILALDGIRYEIIGTLNFIIATIIAAFFNGVFGLLFGKK